MTITQLILLIIDLVANITLKKSFYLMLLIALPYTLTIKLCFKVPSRTTRSSLPFLIPFSSSNYLGNSPIKRLMRIANDDPTFNFP